MYQAIYKCRLCGEEFSDYETEKNFAKLATESLTVADSTIAIAGCAMYMRAIHNCEDGSFGLADFQGLKKVEE